MKTPEEQIIDRLDAIERERVALLALLRQIRAKQKRTGTGG